MQAEIQTAIGCDLESVALGTFKQHLESARDISYIGDNIGETVFDPILIEELDKPVIYAARGAPILNDATYADALRVGLDEVASILSSGTNTPGAMLNRCNHEFIETFNNADILSPPKDKEIMKLSAIRLAPSFSHSKLYVQLS